MSFFISLALLFASCLASQNIKSLRTRSIDSLSSSQDFGSSHQFKRPRVADLGLEEDASDIGLPSSRTVPVELVQPGREYLRIVPELMSMETSEDAEVEGFSSLRRMAESPFLPVGRRPSSAFERIGSYNSLSSLSRPISRAGSAAKLAEIRVLTPEDRVTTSERTHFTPLSLTELSEALLEIEEDTQSDEEEMEEY